MAISVSYSMRNVGHWGLYLFRIGKFYLRFGEAHIFAIGALWLFHEAINTRLGDFKVGLGVEILATTNSPRTVNLHCVPSCHFAF